MIQLALATWRVSNLFLKEEGPFAVFLRIRRRAGVDRPGPVGTMATLFSCFWCFSVWVGGALAILSLMRSGRVLTAALAASAVTILVEEARAKFDG